MTLENQYILLGENIHTAVIVIFCIPNNVSDRIAIWLYITASYVDWTKQKKLN